MENYQIAIFEELQQQEQFTKVQAAKSIASEKQKQRVVAFDVGEKIGGSRKDIEELKRLFIINPSADLLQEIEEESFVTAAKVVSKDLFFKWFSLEDCRKRGMEVREAKIIESLIRRIAKHPADDTISRIKYLNTVKMMSDLLRSVTTKEDYKMMFNYVVEMLWASRASMTPCEDKRFENLWQTKRINQSVLSIAFVQEKFDFIGLGDNFRNFFFSYSARQKLIVSIEKKYPSWDAVLNTTKATKKRATVKPVWVRETPKVPTRIGPNMIIPSHPEKYLSYFGFKGIEFGHYVDDLSAMQHMRHSGEALIDLARFLQVDIKDLSLNGRLSLAFGARGRGKALGHYEQEKEVINLTKEKGSLGVLAHEWAHALDHYLYNASHGFVKGRLGMLSEFNEGMEISHISDQLANMMFEMKRGESLNYIKRSHKYIYEVKVSHLRLYRKVKGDAVEFMKELMLEREATIKRHFSMILSNEKEIERKVASHLKKSKDSYANLFGQIHEQETGEVLTSIPCPSQLSAFYNTSIEADKGKVGKYWSSNTEMFARAFEYTVQRYLKEQKLVSDYLVCGAEGNVYPTGEEGERIYKMMKEFLAAVSEFLVTTRNAG